MATRKKTQAAAPDPGEHVARARALLADSAALKLSALGPAAVRKQVAAALVQEGFEVTTSFVRKPLRAQLLSALEHGALLSLKGIGAHVVGASAADATRAANELAKAGAAKLVLRGKALSLCSNGTRTLGAAQLRTLDRELADLKKLVGQALKAKVPTCVLVTDVEDTLARALPQAASAAARPERPAPQAGVTPQLDDRLSQVLRAVDAARDVKLGLSFVPRVVELLALEALSIEGAQAALLDAAERGAVELRPEGGLNRLSAAELLLCLPGPQGTKLSWVKRHAGAT